MPTNKFVVELDLTEFSKGARKHLGKDWPKAVVKSFAKIAEIATVDNRKMTKQKFKLHTDYITQGIRYYPKTTSQKERAEKALKRFGDMNAAVYLRGSRTPAKSLEFMAHHEYGEEREALKKWIAIPMTDLRKRNYKTGRGMVKLRWRPERLLRTFRERGSSFGPGDKTTTNRGLHLGPIKDRLPGAAFLIRSRGGDPMIVRRISRASGASKGDLEFLYIFKESATINKNWDFVSNVYSSVVNNYFKVIHQSVKRMPDYGKGYV